MSLRIHEIVSLDDALYDCWLDLYQTAFPLAEQALASDHNRVLRARMRGEVSHRRLLAAVDEADRLVGMAVFDVRWECRCGHLVYLAVAPERRNEGAGAWVFQEIVGRVQRENPGLIAVCIEVEDPDLAASSEQRSLAERRIAFYQRQGAELLYGIDYTLSLGWQPPLRMLLMLYPLVPIGSAETLGCVKCFFGDAITVED